MRGATKPRWCFACICQLCAARWGESFISAGILQHSSRRWGGRGGGIPADFLFFWVRKSKGGFLSHRRKASSALPPETEIPSTSLRLNHQATSNHDVIFSDVITPSVVPSLYSTTHPHCSLGAETGGADFYPGKAGRRRLARTRIPR